MVAILNIETSEAKKSLSGVSGKFGQDQIKIAVVRLLRVILQWVDSGSSMTPQCALSERLLE